MQAQFLQPPGFIRIPVPVSLWIVNFWGLSLLLLSSVMWLKISPMGLRVFRRGNRGSAMSGAGHSDWEKRPFVALRWKELRGGREGRTGVRSLPPPSREAHRPRGTQSRFCETAQSRGAHEQGARLF